MSPLIQRILRHPLTLGFALLALTAGTVRAGDNPFQQYTSNGFRGSRGQSIAGNVRFGLETDDFRASFNPSMGIVYQFTGDYEEVNLFIISFWTFTGSDNQLRGGTFGATGSGIRLFFGLLVFGTLEDHTGVPYSFSGLFDEVVQSAPGSDRSARFVGEPIRPEHAARLRRRPLAIESL